MRTALEEVVHSWSRNYRWSYGGRRPSARTDLTGGGYVVRFDGPFSRYDFVAPDGVYEGTAVDEIGYALRYVAGIIYSYDSEGYSRVLSYSDQERLEYEWDVLARAVR